KIYASIFAIKQKYREEGLLDVEVRHKFSKEDNKLVLVFDISEGPKSIVKSIKFIGVSNVSEGDLKGIMDTKEEVKFIGLPINRGYFDPDKLSKDMDKIKYFYQMKGFIDAKITLTNITISNYYDSSSNLIEKHVYVSITLEEGEKYYFRNVSISSNLRVFSSNEILNKFPLIKGDVFAQDKIDKWIYSVNRLYWDRGYIFAKVDKKVVKDDAYKFVDLVVEIYEGDIGHIGNIIIVGNTYTKSYVIERELEVTEGEIFTVYKLQRSIERLNMTQYFEKVEWEVKEGDAEGIMDLIFKVKEGRTGIISLSAGYGSVSGFTMGGSISHINLFGTGKKIQGKIDVGQNQQGINLSFTEPYISDSNIGLSISIYFYNTLIQNIYVDEDNDALPESTNGSYWQTRLGLGVNLPFRFASYYSLGFGYSIYSTITHDKNFNNPYSQDVAKELSLTYVDNWWEVYRGKLKSMLSFNFTFDSRNNPLVPSKGVNGGVYFDYVGHLIGGFFRFLKLSGNFSFYQAIPIVNEYNLVWVLYTTHGVILPQLDGSLEYETMDLFWFDGYYELRGWGGYGIRGKAKSFYSTELRFPISGNELWGTLFFDIGSSFDDVILYTTSLDKYYGSFGIGVMINIPGLPIRIYLARQLKFQDNVPKLYISDQFFNNWQFVFAIQGLF
ncbi:MAG: outer membrane protein assembly factor BamA, partial [Brevinematia bacterium]